MTAVDKVSVDIVKHLEKLTLIRFTEEEREKIEKEVRKVMELFNEIMKVEGLDNIEPLYHVVEIELPLRDDEVLDKIDENHEFLKDNAILEKDYVKAPKTVGA
ncbi:Asp-tRNA(Asn)/Glu-tRNA(Gln) amidotransferase subunit GatC [Ignisphaera sp. 4213-co]|uniref:Asp-tRNA(Asn)/Glu-tRNA(Gln) amidotransferase subunit GatC n=1 Tax=Ignisphaera cupida TaxID=3050454 RepID=A0ABD4Z8C2_9CREN|nr:Asp-tRNA(Asn)/Glu-tRNA(Gln) amidotransferase subunit GatC [Ignisphaera sp. 4213-co]MDK6029489.1 Asp-tRNA(Asn)/Glu-tRNA(Gln) amidotransferase subunit GatC [Ignisphaera sp. 4213-co]